MTAVEKDARKRKLRKLMPECAWFSSVIKECFEGCELSEGYLFIENGLVEKKGKIADEELHRIQSRTGTKSG